jgi:type II secretory pathway pseudopilin PulG
MSQLPGPIAASAAQAIVQGREAQKKREAADNRESQAARAMRDRFDQQASTPSTEGASEELPDPQAPGYEPLWHEQGEPEPDDQKGGRIDVEV